MTYLLVFTVFDRRHGQSSNCRGETKDLTIYFQHAVIDRIPNAQKKEEMCHAVSRPGKHLRPSWRYGCNDLTPPTECYFYRRHMRLLRHGGHRNNRGIESEEKLLAALIEVGGRASGSARSLTTQWGQAPGQLHCILPLPPRCWQSLHDAGQRQRACPDPADTHC